MSSHAAATANWRSRLVKSRESMLMRVAFGTAGAAVSAGLAGLVALATW